MLFADKRNLETNLQVNLLKIREKELQFYVQNCISSAFHAQRSPKPAAETPSAALYSGYAVRCPCRVRLQRHHHGGHPRAHKPLAKGRLARGLRVCNGL